MMLEERYHEEFYEAFGRGSTGVEVQEIEQRAFDNIGDYCADLADSLRDQHKDKTL